MPRTAGLLLVAVILGLWLLALPNGFIWSLTAIFAIGVALVVAAPFNPTLGLFGVSLLSTIDVLSRVFLTTRLGLKWNAFGYLLTGVALLFVGRLRQQMPIPMKLFIGLLLLMLVEIGLSSAPWVGVQQVFEASSYLMFCFFGMRVKDSDTWYWNGIVCGSVAALGGAIYFSQIDTLPQLINKNAWSYFPITAMFSLAIARFVRASENRVRPIAYLPIVFLAVTSWIWTVLSGSRGGIVVASVCLIYILHLRRLSRRVIYLLIGLGCMMGLLQLFPEIRDASVGQITKSFQADRTVSERTSGRSDLFAASMTIVAEHPMGIGTGGFPLAYAVISRTEIAGMEAFNVGSSMNAHAAWLQVLTENGVIALVLLAAFVLSFWWTERTRRRGLGIGTLVTVALTAAFCATEFQSKGLWFLSACATALLWKPEPLQSAREAIYRRWRPSVERRDAGT